MQIIRNLQDLPNAISNPVVTIGNFDGVHLGHREIFSKVTEAAAACGGVSLAITFDPHPLKVLAPEKKFRLITTREEKEALIASTGIDYLVSIPFTRDLAAISAEEFVRDILVRRIGLKKIIIGYDYAFGRNRQGNVDLLRLMGKEYGFAVEMLEQIGKDGITYSSSMVRSMIENGDVEGVVPFLGRYFSVSGQVVHGLHRGKGLGFPTANVLPEEELLPKSGVYAVKVLDGERERPGACNIGFNPTFNNGTLSVEVHILDFEGDLYGRKLKVNFVRRIRDERTFSDVVELKKAIENDVALCRGILSGNGSSPENNKND